MSLKYTFSLKVIQILKIILKLLTTLLWIVYELVVIVWLTKRGELELQFLPRLYYYQDSSNALLMTEKLSKINGVSYNLIQIGQSINSECTWIERFLFRNI